MRSRRRELGSKYFGRAIKKWRLFAGLSQEELAGKAQVSVTSLGTIERERGHLSEEIICKLCLGLESTLGRPMLRLVLSDATEALWQELLSSENGLRQERGGAATEKETFDVTDDDLDRALDSTLAEVKKLALLWYRGLALRKEGGTWLPATRFGLSGEEAGSAVPTGQVRVRRSGQGAKRPTGAEGRRTSSKE